MKNVTTLLAVDVTTLSVKNSLKVSCSFTVTVQKSATSKISKAV